MAPPITPLSIWPMAEKHVSQWMCWCLHGQDTWTFPLMLILWPYEQGSWRWLSAGADAHEEQKLYYDGAVVIGPMLKGI